MGGTEGALAVRLVAGPPPGFPSGPGGLRSLRELGRAGAGGAEPSVCGLPALVTPGLRALLMTCRGRSCQGSWPAPRGAGSRRGTSQRGGSRRPPRARMCVRHRPGRGTWTGPLETTVSYSPRQRLAREAEAARLKKLQEQEKQQKVEFRKRMEKEVSDFIQDSGQIKKKFQPMNKIERSILHDVVEVAGLTSFSFGEDDECRYVMIFKKEFAPSDEELDSYRRGEEWDPQKAEEKRKLKELAQRQEEEAAQQGPVVVSPASDYKDKYSHLIGKGAAKDAAHMLQANKTYGCVPVANKRDTRSIEEAMNEIRAKKRLRQSGEELPPTS
nr:sperm-associated antigen 7 isoform X1 [Vulpes vulpes]